MLRRAYQVCQRRVSTFKITSQLQSYSFSNRPIYQAQQVRFYSVTPSATTPNPKEDISTLHLKQEQQEREQERQKFKDQTNNNKTNNSNNDGNKKRFTKNDMLLTGVMIACYIAGVIYITSDKFLDTVMRKLISKVLAKQSEDDSFHFKSISYDSVHGCLLCGKLRFKKLQLKFVIRDEKADDDGIIDEIDYDLVAEHVMLALPHWSALYELFTTTSQKTTQILTMPLLNIEGMDMNMNRRRKKQTTTPTVVAEKKKNVAMQVTSFEIRNSKVQVNHGSANKTIVAFDYLNVLDTFHFETALYDLAFTSVIAGSINNRAFSVDLFKPKSQISPIVSLGDPQHQSSGEEVVTEPLTEFLDSAISEWRMNSVSVEALYQLFFPFNASHEEEEPTLTNQLVMEALRDATVTLHVKNRPVPAVKNGKTNHDVIEMHWNFTFKNVTALDKAQQAVEWLKKNEAVQNVTSRLKNLVSSITSTTATASEETNEAKKVASAAMNAHQQSKPIKLLMKVVVSREQLKDKETMKEHMKQAIIDGIAKELLLATNIKVNKKQ